MKLATDRKQKNKKPDHFFDSWGFLVMLSLVASFIAISYFFSDPEDIRETAWLTFKHSMLQAHEVDSVNVINREVVEVYVKPEKLHDPKHAAVAKKGWGKSLHTGPHYFFNIGSVEVFEQQMREAQADLPEEDWVPIHYLSRAGWALQSLPLLMPVIFFFLFIWLLSRKPGMGRLNQRRSYGFGKTTAQLYNRAQENSVSFDQVAGMEEAKVEVKEIVDFLRYPEYFTNLGAKIPKGVMFLGPPGTGKTLLAKAVAGEADVPFFFLSGAEFVEMYVGVGASRVRDLFREAKENAPSIIFIDEIDAIGRNRARDTLNSSDERESTLNQLLAEMDGFGTNSGVIVLAATNRMDILDKALLRPGRFDRLIYLELPTLSERKAIFNVHIKPLKLQGDIHTEVLAAQTPGFSGADIANICNEAALIAARKKKIAVEMQHFREATDRLMAGLEKRSKIISPEEKEIIAYHEAGHATVSWLLPHVDPLIKVSVVPRGKTLGAAWYLPQEHQIYTKAQLQEKICAALGGRAAEEVIFGEVTSGALDDLERVTKQAYMMVAYYGLNKKIGNISFYDAEGEQERFMQRPYSEATARLIDREVHQLVEQLFITTKELVLQHKEQLTQLALLLLAQEEVYQADIERIFGNRPDQHSVAQVVKKGINQ